MRSGKGNRDRVAPLPITLVPALRSQLDDVRQQHAADVRAGAGWVELPFALARKLPNAGRELAWQWVFPATRLYLDRETSQRRSTTCTRPCYSAPSAKRRSRCGSRSA